MRTSVASRKSRREFPNRKKRGAVSSASSHLWPAMNDFMCLAVRSMAALSVFANVVLHAGCSDVDRAPGDAGNGGATGASGGRGGAAGSTSGGAGGERKSRRRGRGRRNGLPGSASRART